MKDVTDAVDPVKNDGFFYLFFNDNKCLHI